jgi:predicted MFS family arabinose efflux permease
LQFRVLKSAGNAGRTLASSLNIGAFNLGNALGAWAGGIATITAPASPRCRWSLQQSRRPVCASRS